MLHLLRTLFWGICRWLSHARYRVRVVGGEKLRELRGPTLIMPNHPAYIDPPLVMAHLWLPGGIRPVVVETMYRIPVLYPLFRFMDSLEVPELRRHSRDARQQTLALIDAIVEGLGRGESFLLYPAGRAARRGIEEIGGNRAAAEILSRSPQANVVLVRTRGLWGSMFSYAPTGGPPNLGRCFLRALGWLLVNLLVFVPRREVTMTVEVVDRRDLPELDREKLNRYLEAWYNRDPEQPVFVPYHRLLGPREFQFPRLATDQEVDPSKIKPATIRAVNDLIEEQLGRPLSDEERQPDATLDRLGLDSLDRMDLALRIEDRFGFHADQVAGTLGDFWALAEGLLTGSASAGLQAPPAWSRPPHRPGPAAVLAETLVEAFVRRALAYPDDVAAADQLSGVLSYRKLLVGARLMARRFSRLPDNAVGVLLPSSVAADVTFFALHLAGKLPVLLNWTTGPANLAHAVRTLDIHRVITSQKLIDRLGIEVPGAEFVFLEDLRAGVGKLEAAMALVGTHVLPRRMITRRPGSSLRPSEPPHGNGGALAEDAPAVVLFTSGSESTPKAVPLSHRNLVTNARASLDVLKPNPDDSMLAILPPFHSFGLLGNVVAPILGGIRVVHHSDPTDARGQLRLMAAYRTTYLVTTPTFLSYLLAVATPADLQSLRVIVTGAEKCPEAIFARAKELAPQATIIEGYGITECSPVVAANRPERVRPGTVGQPVEGVEVLVVDPETREPLPPGTTGLLLVRGPSVFHGYLNYDGPDPFVQSGGRQWYVTGDLVRLDEDGYIHFCGRLKRFLKAGGEMISLVALEEPFASLYPPTEQGPQVAVEGIETPQGRLIVLFTTLDIPLRQANAILSDAGFRGVMRLDEVVRLPSIPVLGTGKTDYKALRKMVAARE